MATIDEAGLSEGQEQQVLAMELEADLEEAIEAWKKRASKRDILPRDANSIIAEVCQRRAEKAEGRMR